MALKRHHKIIIGSATSLIFLFMIISGFLMYSLFTRQTLDFNNLNQKILNVDTKLDILTISVNDSQNELKNLGLQIGSIDKEITNLKASVSSDFSSIIGNAIKSVVTVRTDIAQGSGFIIANGGYIVTNAHVMEGAAAAMIVTYDGKTHMVAEIGRDNIMDIALLKIDDTGYPLLGLGDSDDVQLGDKVIAIGNPLGLQFSVSEGIISGINRPGLNGINEYLQTDAALNPGNSGGPLISANGEAIGINNFKIGGSENIGFALESNSVKDSVNAIFRHYSGGGKLI